MNRNGLVTLAGGAAAAAVGALAALGNADEPPAPAPPVERVVAPPPAPPPPSPRPPAPAPEPGPSSVPAEAPVPAAPSAKAELPVAPPPPMKAPDAAPVAEQPPLPPALRWSDLSSSPPVMHETTVRTATKFVPPGHAGVTAPEDGVKIERTEVEPTGAYANIDVRAMNKSLAVLADLDHPAERAAEAARLEAHPEKGAPPLLFAMGRALFDGGRKEDGAFWYYAGMLRGRFDARRCADPSVGDTVTVMIRTYGPPISKWAYLDLDAMEKRIDRVVRWDEKTPREYDHRWINLNGIGAILSGLPGRDGVMGSMAPRKLSVPESEWPAIEKKTRDEFVATFRELLADMRKKR